MLQLHCTSQLACTGTRFNHFTHIIHTEKTAIKTCTGTVESVSQIVVADQSRSGRDSHTEGKACNHRFSDLFFHRGRNKKKIDDNFCYFIVTVSVLVLSRRGRAGRTVRFFTSRAERFVRVSRAPDGRICRLGESCVPPRYDKRKGENIQIS